MKQVPVDTSTLTFIHFGSVEAATAQDGKQRTTQEGVPLWRIPVVVLTPGAKVPEGSNINVPAPQAPKLENGAEVKFRGLRARLWTMNGSSGLSLSADAVEQPRTKSSQA
jgi:hypothetical protein